MSPGSSRLVGLLSLALVAGPGCMASFTPLPEEPAPAGTRAPVPLLLSVEEDAYLQVAPDRWRDWPSAGLADAAARAIWRSGWVVPANEPGAEDSAGGEPLELALTVRSYQGLTRGSLAALTLFVLPAATDHKLDVSLTVLGAGWPAQNCTQSRVVRSWSQILLLFAYPFRSPARRRMQTVERLAVGCLVDVLETRTPSGGDRAGR